MTKHRPLVLGLTGSIGMGKTETAKLFAKLGVPVHDADAAVHKLYERGGSLVDEISRAFPGTVRDGKVDRAALAMEIGTSAEKLKRLEQIVHPLVAQEQRAFIEKAAQTGAEIVVLDVPLLYETGGHTRMDTVVVVSAPREIQRARVLSRPGMTPEKLDRLLARQMPDAEKRAQAHFVVETDKGLDHAFVQVKEIVAALRERRRRETGSA
ncbi:MAG: dephospho-CoA kinase [Alphaproteobacteria bacterium]|nr:dephospho-CoA kinase [Alphaproteobacteria bacterium]